MSDLNIKILNFILNGDIWSRREGSRIIRETFGEEGYAIYQDLWRRGCLKVNDWACLVPTRKGYLEERKIKGWDVRRSGETRTPNQKVKT